MGFDEQMLLSIGVNPEQRHGGRQRPFFKRAAYPQIQQHQSAGLLVNFLLLTRLRLSDDDAPAAVRQFGKGFLGRIGRENGLFHGLYELILLRNGVEEWQ